MARFKLYRFITDEGKAFAFDNVGDFDFWVVVPIIVKYGREILPGLLRQNIAIVATVLLGNADIFNSGFHATVVLVPSFGLPKVHTRFPPVQTRWYMFAARRKR